MVEAKVKTGEAYSKRFCEMMNKDEEIRQFSNQKLGDYVIDASKELFIAHKNNDVKAGSKALSDAVKKIMSFTAFLYAKAREKEDEINKEV